MAFCAMCFDVKFRFACFPIHLMYSAWNGRSDAVVFENNKPYRQIAFLNPVPVTNPCSVRKHFSFSLRENRGFAKQKAGREVFDVEPIPLSS